MMQSLDLNQVSLDGEFGRRVDAIIEENILKIDVEEAFLSEFRRTNEVPVGSFGRYLGFGKFIDAVVRLAAGTRDERLLTLKKRTISELLATQEADGYLGAFADSKMRVEYLHDLHEGAYLIWALVSDYRLFRERASLQAAQRLADFFIGKFTENPALRVYKPMDITFHPVASVGWDRALLALSEVSGEAKYRNFAIDVVRVPDYVPPINTGTTAWTNHVYSQLSYCLAQLDLYRQKPDPRLLTSTRRVVDFLCHGGEGLLVTGSCSLWECWHDNQSGGDNLSETCAGVYLARLMEAMLQIEGNSLYGDILERTIYNALFAATSPDGSRSRYFTPFEGERPYDAAAPRYCCANNNKRFLGDLRSWMYYRTEQGVAVNLYNASTATLDINGSVKLRLEQQTNYPSSGNVLLKIDPSEDAHFEVKLRIPRWCQEATISINGSRSASVAGGQFYGLERRWKEGDSIELKMPMEWRFIRGRRAQEGRAAILRGPVIFTFNPERNTELSTRSGFDARLLKIHPGEIDPPTIDESVRPGGVSCQIKVWPPGVQPWPIVPRVPLVLSEYPDPGGRAIYFTVPGEGKLLLVQDELISVGHSRS